MDGQHSLNFEGVPYYADIKARETLGNLSADDRVIWHRKRVAKEFPVAALVDAVLKIREFDDDALIAEYQAVAKERVKALRVLKFRQNTQVMDLLRKVRELKSKIYASANARVDLTDLQAIRSHLLRENAYVDALEDLEFELKLIALKYRVPIKLLNICHNVLLETRGPKAQDISRQLFNGVY